MKRFSECWQISADNPGTASQRLEVEGAYHLIWGTNKHKLFKALDKAINSIQRSTFFFGFPEDDMFNPWDLAIAGRTGINMRASIAVSAIHDLALHELGHVVDKHLMTWAKRLDFMFMAGIDPNTNTWNHNVQETFADAVRDMILGTKWQELWALVLEA